MGELFHAYHAATPAATKISFCPSILRSDGDRFVNKTMKGFDKKAFMVTLSQDIMVDVEAFTHSGEHAFKWAAIIQNKKMPDTEFQKNMLHKILGECSRSFIRNRNDNNKLGYITHDIHESNITVATSEVARYPKVSVKDCER